MDDVPRRSQGPEGSLDKDVEKFLTQPLIAYNVDLQKHAGNLSSFKKYVLVIGPVIADFRALEKKKPITAAILKEAHKSLTELQTLGQQLASL